MKNNQIGRSMIEMLGVLAIIAVLSVFTLYEYRIDNNWSNKGRYPEYGL